MRGVSTAPQRYLNYLYCKLSTVEPSESAVELVQETGRWIPEARQRLSLSLEVFENDIKAGEPAVMAW